jgi:hypothetical protein
MAESEDTKLKEFMMLPGRVDFGMITDLPGRFKGPQFRSCLTWPKGSSAVVWVSSTSFFPLPRHPALKKPV